MKTIAKMIDKLLNDYQVSQPDNVVLHNKIKDIQFAYKAQLMLFEETEKELKRQRDLGVKAGYCIAKGRPYNLLDKSEIIEIKELEKDIINK